VVFVDEQGIDDALEYDHEDETHRYLTFLDNQPIATARWREIEPGLNWNALPCWWHSVRRLPPEP